MPTYEFRCPLGHEFEKFYRSIGTSEAQAACPECGQLAERMMSAGAGLVFKGSGFYLTDYGKNAHQKKGPAEPKGESSGGEGGGKSEGGGSSSAESTTASSGEAHSRDAKTESKKTDATPAEAKPAPKPPKPSAGE